MSVFEGLKTFFVLPNTIPGATFDPILAQNRREARQVLTAFKNRLHHKGIRGRVTRELRVVSSDRIQDTPTTPHTSSPKK
jgi:hypothetical protein